MYFGVKHPQHLFQKSLEKQMCSSNTRDVVPIDREQLISELTNLRAQRERVIEERKQFDLELKGLNMQVQKKVSSLVGISRTMKVKVRVISLRVSQRKDEKIPN